MPGDKEVSQSGREGSSGWGGRSYLSGGGEIGELKIALVPRGWGESSPIPLKVSSWTLQHPHPTNPTDSPCRLHTPILPTNHPPALLAFPSQLTLDRVGIFKCYLTSPPSSANVCMQPQRFPHVTFDWCTSTSSPLKISDCIWYLVFCHHADQEIWPLERKDVPVAISSRLEPAGLWEDATWISW